MVATLLIAVAAGTLVGVAVVVALLRSRAGGAADGRVAALQAEATTVRAELTAVRADAAAARQELAAAVEARGRAEAALEAERRAAAEKLELLKAAEQALGDRFEALSAQALERNNRQFLDLASESYQKLSTQAVGPLAAQLKGVETHLRELERTRQEAYGKVEEQLRSVSEAHHLLRTETASLVTALRKPTTRGQWGEMQLRRVVEVAGLTNHCDFSEQATIDGADGRIRPDLVVHLPGGKHVIVDAKAPLEAYLEALEADDDLVRRQKLAAHARQLRSHVDKLAAKSYADQLRGSPKFVFLFVPGDGILAAAYEADPSLQEHAATAKVIITSPSLLIVMLQAVATGWQQEALAENAQQVCDLGKQLYDRLGTMAGHIDKLGRSLNAAVGSFNDTVGSLEKRVLVSARKFADLHVVGESAELPMPALLDRHSRPMSAPELTDRPDTVLPHGKILGLGMREEAAG